MGQREGRVGEQAPQALHLPRARTLLHLLRLPSRDRARYLLARTDQGQAHLRREWHGGRGGRILLPRTFGRGTRRQRLHILLKVVAWARVVMMPRGKAG